MLKDYYHLTKPGIIRGNIITAVTGYFVAVGNTATLREIILLVVGLTGVIAGACVFNNILDKNIDKKMKRTKDRAVAAGRVRPINAGMYGSALSMFGLVLLYQASWRAALLALIAALLYVVVYGYAKRSTPFGTSVGAVPGALPPVIGYVADGRGLDIVALGLFIVLVVWQMPHFYAIAMFRSKEYSQGGVRVVSHRLSEAKLRRRIESYIILFGIVVAWLGTLINASLLYFAVALLISIFWIRITGGRSQPESYGRAVFGASLLVLLVLCAALTIDAVLLRAAAL